MDDELRVVVVGGGMAAARLTGRIDALRAAGAAVPAVTVVGEEPCPAYNRVLLAEVLGGRYPAEVAALPAASAMVRWLRGVRVVRVDRDERRVLCDDGQELPYDALVLCTGSNPVLPPLRGLTHPGGDDGLPLGVPPFRTMADGLALDQELRASAPNAPSAVVVGGGLLGVSAARALARRGARVVLAQQGQHLMERQLDPDAAQVLRARLAESGVEVHTECRVRGVRTRYDEESGSRRVTAVELADGALLEARLLVLACGVRPRTGLARAAGLEVARGIVVDDRLRTSDPRIFALGDCAEHAGVLYGLAGPAQDQADVLARVLTAPADAPPPAYRGTRALTRLTLSGDGRDPLPLDLAAFGETVPAPGDDVVRLADATRGRYRKVVVRGDRLVGGILLGDLGTVGALARTWEGDEPLPSSPLLHLLTNDGGS